jgi:tellurite resistance protein TerC
MIVDWLLFAALIIGIVAADLHWFGGDQPPLKTSSIKTAVYVLVALAYGAWIAWGHGYQAALQFYTGYSLEMSLSFDNVFVISLILGALAIPAQYRGRVLFYGIIGAVVLRGIFIGLGAAIVGQFHWVLVGFAGFLLFTGIRMLFDGEDEGEYDIESNKTLRLLRRFVPIATYVPERFFFVPNATIEFRGKVVDVRWAATPLFVALVLVEVADVVFAVDSIPATFAITTDPLLVFTSNIFAIVGLRSLFFVLEAAVHRFKYLTPALSIVLVFIGAKVLIEEFTPIELPIPVSLGIVLGILASGIVVSLLRTKTDGKTSDARTDKAV